MLDQKFEPKTITELIPIQTQETFCNVLKQERSLNIRLK